MTIETIKEKLPIADYVKDGISASRTTINRLEEEGEKMFKNLTAIVDRVKPEEQRVHLDEVVDSGKKLIAELETRIEDGISNTLSMLSIPTKGDIERIELKLEQIVEELEALKKKAAKRATGGGKKAKTASKKAETTGGR